MEIKLSNEDNLEYNFDSKRVSIKDFFKFNNFNKNKTLEIIGNKFSVDFEKGLINYKINSFEFDTFISGIKYNLLDKKKEGIVYSYIHLEKILDKYEYKNPIYYEKNSVNYYPLINIREINGFQFLTEINISEKKEDVDKLENIYEELINIYNKEITIEETINIKELTPNFKNYFIKQNNCLEMDTITIFISSIRNNIISEIIKFISEKNEKKIFALCGPFGIGKSFTSLLIQKFLYYKKYPTLYINFSLTENINDLKMVIIKELFFLIFDKEKYLSVSKIILNTIAHSLWELIIIIDDFCDINKIEYLLILDQYQQNVDKKEQLNTIKTKKIFLLSSINDTDVKMNLVTQIKKEKRPLINYVYLNSFFLINETLIKELLKNQDKNIIDILKYFNYMPVSLFQLEYIYQWNILDFINYQFWLILKNLSKFFKKTNINIIILIFCHKNSYPQNYFWHNILYLVKKLEQFFLKPYLQLKILFLL